jgi:hypothetical protein
MSYKGWLGSGELDRLMWRLDSLMREFDRLMWKLVKA